MSCNWVKNILPDLQGFHKNKMADSGEGKGLGELFFLITIKLVHFGQSSQMSKHPTSFANHPVNLSEQMSCLLIQNWSKLLFWVYGIVFHPNNCFNSKKWTKQYALVYIPSFSLFPACYEFIHQNCKNEVCWRTSSCVLSVLLHHASAYLCACLI